MTCRTLDEIRAAAQADGRADPPISQDLADYVAALRASAQPVMAGAA